MQELIDVYGEKAACEKLLFVERDEVLEMLRRLADAESDAEGDLQQYLLDGVLL